ncbi:hypothetical protein AKJ56_01000 [candidate division MSBL1 archaeon SCGC-AAA382N08]|uniref:Uncharacterized protein n=1 Tax=candidate division MSBL1 archaeon SCGC-AAA382N08 TaxID=1698285 RepID=A0A133VQ29_9EURY|nr:hypothetical protein AKJ56_01000 [candidate division MSBL1 archaeon SCGC-AAA382N08]
MKFISKYPNFRVVLKSGTSGNRQTGEQGTPAKNVKFEYGVANVVNEEDIKLMMQHSGFGYDKNADFIPADEYEASKHTEFDQVNKGQEPSHNIAQMDKGVPISQTKREGKPQQSSGGYSAEDVKKLAKEMAMEVLPDMVDKEIKRREATKDESIDSSQPESSETAEGNMENEPLAEDVNTKEEESASEDVKAEVKKGKKKKAGRPKKRTSTKSSSATKKVS